MKAKPLFPNQTVTQTGLPPSKDLIEIIQRIVADILENETAIAGIADDFSNGTWVPTITAGAGTITTIGAVVARYRLVGQMVFISLDITITTNGTGSLSVRATLPFTAASLAVMAGREDAVTGSMLQGDISPGSGSVRMFTYNNLYPGGTGYRLFLSGWYERT